MRLRNTFDKEHLEIFRKIQFFLFLLTLFSLPLFETPKNILITLGLILFIIRHYINRDLKQSLFSNDTRLGFLLLSLASLLSSVSTLYPTLALRGFVDLMKMYIVFIILMDFRDIKSLNLIVLVLVAATVIAIIWGYYQVFTGKLNQFELKSVGHVNHTSIYLGLCLLVTSSLSTSNKIELRTHYRLFLIVSSVLIAYTIIFAGSRATIVALVFVFLSAVLFSKIPKKIIIISIFIAIILSFVLLNYMLFPNSLLFSKTYSFSDTSLLERLKIWSDAWRMFKENPILGVGAKHFKFYCSLKNGTHAHNLFLNTLAQLGIIGFMALIYLIFRVATDLRKSDRSNPFWCSAVLGLGFVLINGLFNTTLHSEHGILFAVLCALGFGKVKNPSPTPSPEPRLLKSSLKPPHTY